MHKQRNVAIAAIAVAVAGHRWHDDAYGQGIKSFGAEWHALTPAGEEAGDDDS